MVALMPRDLTDDDRALLTVVKQMRRTWDWDVFLLGWSWCFHLAVAVTLAAAPWDQLYTAGTKPVLDITSRYVWAGIFAALTLLLCSLHRPRHLYVRATAWLTVGFLCGMWLTAFSLAVLRDAGSALGVVTWLFLYIPQGAVAFRDLRKR